MSGSDREPIGRREQMKKYANSQNQRRRYRNRDDYDNELYDSDELDEGDSDDDDEEPETNKKKRPRRRYRWFWLLFKLGLVFFALLAFYGFYLDAQIREKLEGKVWQLPAAVYGRMVNLEPGMSYSKQEMVALLEGMQYRQVARITRPGEFTVTTNTIELLRRPFEFPDVKEGQINARLHFDASGLSRIQNLDSQRDFGFFRLDPRLITMMQSTNGEQRLFVPRNGFPDLLVDTLLATEDRYFYQHDGVNLYSIGRAFLANLVAGRTVQGGSTLTQQLVKNLFLTNERSWRRKLNEAYMAVLVDYRYSKDRILELYLNEVFLGQSGSDQIRGFPLASLYYFGRPVNELSLDQQAMLVGMVKGASLYNPWRNPEKTLERRNLVLQVLLNQNIIDTDLYKMLSVRPLAVQPKGGVITPQPAFMQVVRDELQQRLGDKAVNLSGAKIFTTLDPVSQDAAEKAISEGIPALRSARKMTDLEGAMVVVDRFSGEIRSMVSGSETQYAGFNRALQARRSIGSLAKPLVYLTALGQPDNYRLNTWLADQPLVVPLVGSKNWQPRNYDRRFRGQVMLVDALASSLNIPTVNLGMMLGLPQVIGTLQQLGIAKELVDPVPAMLLGAINLTPMEITQAYQTLASGGNFAKLSALRSVIAEDGRVLYQSLPQSERRVSSQATYLTLYAMQQGVISGTSRSLASKFSSYHLAGKTGTTNDLRDSWFAGIDGKEVAISWVGRDNNGSTNLTGASGALTLYRRYLENQTPLPLMLAIPEDIQAMNIDTAGNFVCNGGGVRTLPVWTDNPQSLCSGQASTPLSYQPQIDTTPEPDEQSEKPDEAPGWIREMFGQ